MRVTNDASFAVRVEDPDGIDMTDMDTEIKARILGELHSNLVTKRNYSN